MHSFTPSVAHIASVVIVRHEVPKQSLGMPPTEIATPSARNGKEGGEVAKQSSQAFALWES